MGLRIEFDEASAYKRTLTRTYVLAYNVDVELHKEEAHMMDHDGRNWGRACRCLGVNE